MKSAWILLVIVLSIKTLLDPFAHSVFEIYHWAALGWWNDLPIYRPNGVFDLFRYPPLFAIAFTPLALLGHTLGGLVWIWLSLGIYALGCRRFLNEVLPDAGRWRAVYSLVCLVGAIASLWNSQANAIICGMTLLGAVEVVRGRSWRAALWLGCSVLIKVTPLAVVGLLLLVRLPALAPRLAIILGVGFLLPFLTRPPATVGDQVFAWLHQMELNTRIRWPGYRDAWTLYQGGRLIVTGEPIALTEPNNVPGYRLAQLASAGFAGLWVLVLLTPLAWMSESEASARGAFSEKNSSLTLRARMREASMSEPEASARGKPYPSLTLRARIREAVTLAVALGGCWSLLFGPSVEHSTLVVLMPSLAGAIASADQPGRWGRPLLLAALVCIVPLTGNGIANALRPLVPLIDCAMPFGVVLAVLWFLGWSLRPMREIALSERSVRLAA